MTSAQPLALDTRARHLPGEIGIWVFIFGDLIVFALFFLIFLYYKGHEQQSFADSQQHLNQFLAAVNTVLMLTSSWLVATGVHAARKGDTRVAITGFRLAILCGAGFAAVKYIEYGEKIGVGITLNTNHFYQCYYMFTGTHLMHVLLGMCMLYLMIYVLRSGAADARRIRFVEAGATFWHMVDLLWIVLFALFYLVK
jgi:nitric oxide reductase NorE protein